MEYASSPEAARNVSTLLRLMKTERSRPLCPAELVQLESAKSEAQRLDVTGLLTVMINNGPAMARLLRSTR